MRLPQLQAPAWVQSFLARLRLLRRSAPAAVGSSPDAAAATVEQSIKSELARRRRNTRVRYQEFNHLRALMRAREAGPSSPSSHATASGLNELLDLASSPGNTATEVRNRTIEQIARIESQMAQHWGGRKPGAAAARPVGIRLAQTLDGQFTQPMHLHQRPSADSGLPIDLVPTEPRVAADALGEILSHPSLTQAAQSFAQGQDTNAERSLRSLMLQVPNSLTARVAGLALLDCFHARHDFEAFDEFAAEFAERFGVPVPRWPQSAAASASKASAATSASARSDTWVCPLLLDSTAVSALQALLNAPGFSKFLDFTSLLSADLGAAQALLALAEDWNQRELELRIVGSAVLRRRLKASTPSGRSENERVWWLLRLSLLRTLRRRDEFDLVALDYCVTYGELPPVWELPRCHCQTLHERLPEPEPAAPAAAAEAPAILELDWPNLPTRLNDAPNPGPLTQCADWPAAVTQLAPERPALSGSLRGDCSAIWAELERALPREPLARRCVIDCQGLLRVDFVAASGLMQTLLAARQRGLELELHGLSRLLAAYFHTLGLDEIATLHLRQY